MQRRASRDYLSQRPSKSEQDLSKSAASHNDALHYSSAQANINKYGMAKLLNRYGRSDQLYVNELANKYLPSNVPKETLLEELQLLLDNKTNEILKLRQRRDELQLIYYNAPGQQPIKVSVGLLKEKVKTQEKISDMVVVLSQKVSEMETQIKMMDDYYTYVQSQISPSHEEDTVFDTHAEERLLVENLLKEVELLNRDIREEDNRNAKRIKAVQDDISAFRIAITEKEARIKELKTKICTLHIKANKSADKAINTWNCLKLAREVFKGNFTYKSLSKKICDEPTLEQQLVKISFSFDPRTECVMFKCTYSNNYEGGAHRPQEGRSISPNLRNVVDNKNNPYFGDKVGSPESNKVISLKEISKEEIEANRLVGMKVFLKAKVVGIQCQLKTEKGRITKQIGNCKYNLESELVSFGNTRLVTLASYWNKRDLIGVGFWMLNQGQDKSMRHAKDERSLSNRKNVLESKRFL